MLARVSTALLMVLLAASATADRGVYSFDSGRLLATADTHPLWAGMFARHARESEALADCMAIVESCPKYLRGYRTLIQRAANLKPSAQLTVVNRFFNRKRYRRDTRDAVVGAGEWHTLSRFLEKGGDCEDYAIAKYFAMRELGYEPENLRIVIAYDIYAHDYHAMLAVNVDGTSFFLENDNTIKRGSKQKSYDVTYAINEQFWWDHVTPGGNSRLAKSL